MCPIKRLSHMDDQIPPPPGIGQDTHRTHSRRWRRWMMTVAAVIATTTLVYLISAVLPLARPKGMYSLIGVQMMPPLLLLCAMLGAVLSTFIVAIAAYGAGVRRLGYGLVLLVTACLGFVAFFAGYDSPWFGDRAAARRTFAANLPMYEAMARHRARLRPAIERGDLPSLQAALDAGDPTLTPAQLVCLVRTEVIEGRTGTPPPVSERRYRFLDAVANAAWRSEDDVNGRQTIGLLAVDAALRHGPAADLRRWLERGVQVQGIHWGRDVSELTEPAGQCSTVVYWPLNLLQYNQHNPSDKLALLIEHGVQPDSLMPGRSLFEIAPLSAETVATLAKLGFRPYPGGPERNVGAPLALAIRMAERRCEGDCANVFAFGDDEIVRYMEVLRDAGAEPDQRAWDGRDAWATLFDVRQRLTARQQSDIHTARDCGIVLEPGSAQPDSTRTDLLRRIEQVLRDPPRNSQSSTNPATTSSG